MQGKKFMKILRYINIFTAFVVITFSVLALIFLVVKAVAQFKFFLIFGPAFMACFGLAMVAAQFNVKIVVKKLPFLKTLLGKAIFYIYLSPEIFFYFEFSELTALAWIGAFALFITGVVYICLYFGCGKNLQKQFKEEPELEPEANQAPETQGKQPLM